VRKQNSIAPYTTDRLEAPKPWPAAGESTAEDNTVAEQITLAQRGQYHGANPRDNLA